MRTLRPSDHPSLSSPCRNARERRLHFRIVLGEAHEHADAPHPLRLLRARRERPRRRRAAEQRDELAPPSFDHLVGELLKMQRHVEAERLCGLDVDNQLELGRPFDRQFRRPGAAQHP